MIVTTAESKEVKNLIVDVIGNGGGSICLGYKIINQLVSERNPEGTYDIIHSNLTDALVQKVSHLSFFLYHLSSHMCFSHRPPR